MGKKIIIAVLLGILIVPLLFLGWMYLRYLADKDPAKVFFSPKLEFAQLTITEWNEKNLVMDAALLIHNQLPLPFSADSVAYVLYIEDKEVLRNTSQVSLRLGAMESSAVDLPVVIRLDKLNELKSSSKNLDSVAYRLEVDLYSRIIFKHKRHYTRRQVLPLFQLIEVKAEKIQLKSLKRSGATVNCHLFFSNPNSFPIRIKDLSYELFLDNKFVGNGSEKEKINFEAGHKFYKDFHITIAYKKIGQSLNTYLKKGKKTPFMLRLKFQIQQDKTFTGSSSIIIERDGTLADVLSD